MQFIEALLLGLVQGLTEFFPVSSSGHLILVQRLLGYENLEKYILFDLVCHLGTLGSLWIVLRKEIAQAFFDREQRLNLIVATLPLFPLVIVLKPVKALFDTPVWLGYGFLITACFLFAGNRWGGKDLKAAPNKKDACLIGMAQALAIVPGISRSGATISTGRLQGLAPLQAVLFSFLLSIFTVLGGMTYESLKLLTHLEKAPFIPFSCYILGGTTAFIAGLFTLRLLLRIVGTAKFQLFTWYCAILGVLTILYYS